MFEMIGQVKILTDSLFFTYLLQTFDWIDFPLRIADSKLCGMLVEQVPSLYVELMEVECPMKRVHKVFSELLANALDHAVGDVSDYYRDSAIFRF